MCSESPASSLGVARLLVAALPNLQHVELAALGHRSPITRPEIVNAAIGDCLLHCG